MTKDTKITVALWVVNVSLIISSLIFFYLRNPFMIAFCTTLLVSFYIYYFYKIHTNKNKTNEKTFLLVAKQSQLLGALVGLAFNFLVLSLYFRDFPTSMIMFAIFASVGCIFYNLYLQMEKTIVFVFDRFVLGLSTPIFFLAMCIIYLTMGAQSFSGMIINFVGFAFIILGILYDIFSDTKYNKVLINKSRQKELDIVFRRNVLHDGIIFESHEKVDVAKSCFMMAKEKVIIISINAESSIFTVVNSIPKNVDVEIYVFEPSKNDSILEEMESNYNLITVYRLYNCVPAMVNYHHYEIIEIDKKVWIGDKIVSVGSIFSISQLLKQYYNDNNMFGVNV